MNKNNLILTHLLTRAWLSIGYLKALSKALD